MLGKKHNRFIGFFEGFAEVMYKITGIVMKVAPLGVLGLLAPVVGQYGLSVLLPLVKVIAAVYIACILHAVIVYSSAVKVLGEDESHQVF